MAVSFVIIIFVEAGEGEGVAAAPSLRDPVHPPEPGVSGDGAAGLTRSNSFGSFNICASIAANEAHAEFLERVSERGENGSATGEPVAVESNLGKWRLPFGIFLAIFGGSLSAVQNIPATLYMQHNKKAVPASVVLPQCMGIWAASSLIYLLYSGFARLRKWKVQHSVIRPSYFAGCIWTIGFFGGITGISKLGFSIGFTVASVGPIMVASILSIFVFKEIRGRRQLMLYCAAESLQLVGVLLVAIFGKQAD